MLAHLNKTKADIETHIVEIEQYRLNQQLEMQERQARGVNAKELVSFNFMLGNTKHQIDGLRLELIKAEEKIIAQREIVIAASQEISGLEKLEEKQHEEYNKQVAKEEELQMLEYVITSLVRKKKTA